MIARSHFIALCMVCALCLLSTGVDVAHAGLIEDGLDKIGNIVDLPTGDSDIRMSVVDAIIYILSFLALIAVITIITAGFFLILGFGSETSVQRAKKIIIWTIVGLIVIFFARVIVGFFLEELPSAFS